MKRDSYSVDLGDSFRAFIFALNFHVGWNGRKNGKEATAHYYIICGRGRIDCSNIKGLEFISIVKSAIRIKVIEFLRQRLAEKGHPPIKGSQVRIRCLPPMDDINWSILGNLLVKMGIFRDIGVYSLILGVLGFKYGLLLFKSGGTGGSAARSWASLWISDG